MKFFALSGARRSIYELKANVTLRTTLRGKNAVKSVPISQARGLRFLGWQFGDISQRW